MGSVEVRSWPPHLRQSQARRNHSAASWLPSQERKTIQPDAPGAATAVTGQANARSERSAPACFEREGREPSAPTGDGREGATEWKRDREAHGGIAAGLESSRGVHRVRVGEGQVRKGARRASACPSPRFLAEREREAGGMFPFPPRLARDCGSGLVQSRSENPRPVGLVQHEADRLHLALAPGDVQGFDDRLVRHLVIGVDEEDLVGPGGVDGP